MAPNETYALWLKETANDADAQKELLSIAGDEAEITDRFYRELSFGTAGLRGILGIGTNRMNYYTVGRATQGLADYIKSMGGNTAAIAYDSRNCSETFARRTACVFAGNGVKAYLYRELTPTPSLSYAVREYGCDTGVVITASHNPAPYNGYKAYGPDGCQLGPEQADAVREAMLAADPFTGVRCMDFDEALGKGLIEYIPDSFMIRYLDRVMKESLQPEVCAGSGLRVVYTPLNGAGNKPVREVFARLGLEDVFVVPQQEQPDGNFPTCPYPNPETKEALSLGLSLCREKDADLLIATDPDCDRLGVAVRHEGELRILSGNEVGILLLDYICKTRKKLGTMPENPVAIRSVVSSRMADAVAASYGVEIRSVLTGFKYVGEEIAALEQAGEVDRFLYAYEESCGYLAGSYVRDKDAVNSSMLTVEMAAAYKREGHSLIDALNALYKQHGIFYSAVDSFTFEGAAGMQKMSDIMDNLRDDSPANIGGEAVKQALDYQRGLELFSGAAVALPQTNMIEFHLEGGSSVLVRPSGTEPKIKVYYTVTGTDHTAIEAEAARLQAACAKRIAGR